MSLFKKVVLLSFLGTMVISCQILKSNTASNISDNHGQLGAIGKLSKNGFLSKEFEEVGAINLIQPVRVQVSGFKVRPIKNQNKKDSINQVEEENKGIPLKLKIVDEVTFLNNLNTVENKNYKIYLKENEKSLIRTSGVWIFNEEAAAIILQASSIYLVNNDLSQYALKVQTNGNEVRIIHFKPFGMVGQEYMQVCWQKDIRDHLRIEALRYKGQNCPGNTERRSEKLEKEVFFNLDNY